LFYHLLNHRGLRVGKAAQPIKVSRGAVTKGVEKFKRMMEDDREMKKMIKRLIH
jgi:hypothetical protein